MRRLVLPPVGDSFAGRESRDAVTLGCAVRPAGDLAIYELQGEVVPELNRAGRTTTNTKCEERRRMNKRPSGRISMLLENVRGRSGLEVGGEGGFCVAEGGGYGVGVHVGSDGAGVGVVDGEEEGGFFGAEGFEAVGGYGGHVDYGDVLGGSSWYSKSRKPMSRSM